MLLLCGFNFLRCRWNNSRTPFSNKLTCQLFTSVSAFKKLKDCNCRDITLFDYILSENIHLHTHRHTLLDTRIVSYITTRVGTKPFWTAKTVTLSRCCMYHHKQYLTVTTAFFLAWKFRQVLSSVVFIEEMYKIEWYELLSVWLVEHLK